MGLLDLLMPELAQAEPYLPKQKMKPVSPVDMEMTLQAMTQGVPQALMPNSPPESAPQEMAVPSSGGVKQVAQQQPQAGMPMQSSMNNAGDLDKMYMDIINQRKAAIDKLQGKLGETEKKAPTGLSTVNLQPFLAFADDLTGSKVSYNYQNPNALAKHKDEIAKIQEMLNKNQNSLSDDQLSYLKTKSAEMNAEKKLKMMLEAQTGKKKAGDAQAEMRLRKEWSSDPITKNTKSVHESWQKINQAATGPADPATYMTMVYGLMKMQDPGSTVREGEFKTGEGIGGWPQAWQAMYNKATGSMKGPITDVQKQAILQQAKGIRDAQMQMQSRVDREYKSLAGDNADRIVLDNLWSDEVTVSNGAETHRISREDLPAAQAEGFKVVE